MKKLLVVTPRFPYPLDKGDKLRAFQQIKYLSQFFEIHLFSISEEEISASDQACISQFCKSMKVVQQSRIEIIFHLIRSVFSKKPFQVAYYESDRIRREFKQFLCDQEFKLAYFQLIRTAWLANELNPALPRFMDYMDAMSMNMALRSKREPFPLNILFKMESKRLIHYENHLSKIFKRTFAISERDFAAMNLSTAGNSFVIPNGVDFDFYQVNPEFEREMDVLFVGAMSYVPNQEAALYILQMILPELKKNLPEVSTAIVGPNPGAKLKHFESEHIQVTGWVDDTRPYYSKARLFLAPMFFGTGQQNKILEAMAMGVPVVTSTHANEAIGATHDKEILIANSREEFVFQAKRLLEDEQLRQKIATNAQKFAHEHFSWNAAGEKLKNLLLH